jgi:hypothetical protein
MGRRSSPWVCESGRARLADDIALECQKSRLLEQDGAAHEREERLELTAHALPTHRDAGKAIGRRQHSGPSACEHARSGPRANPPKRLPHLPVVSPDTRRSLTVDNIVIYGETTACIRRDYGEGAAGTRRPAAGSLVALLSRAQSLSHGACFCPVAARFLSPRFEGRRLIEKEPV